VDGASEGIFINTNNICNNGPKWDLLLLALSLNKHLSRQHLLKCTETRIDTNAVCLIVLAADKTDFLPRNQLIYTFI
jgi:hypothetical protein